ncbi:hypothetical protein GUJ93_ZPchr1147g2957 [Zizania palustris]|uniref:CN hydrolase domain-containing protein n=1 Tax=Zizania palustris TaxID=103762 RepID=A0A8J5R626_ZIZPA|nr:hypothetical protein GUJ93_ZPchr1147g2957 [Zizania palustris]
MATAASLGPEAARSPSAVDPPVPPLSKFKVALCQISVTADKARNIARAREAIQAAAADGAKLVLLRFPEYAEDIEAGGDAAPSFSMMSEVAHSLQITLVGGSISERSDPSFDIDIPGKITFKESKTLTAGQDLTVVDTGAHLLCYPGAFNMTTGPLGPGSCCKGPRATDNQLFVATCAPARDTSAGYVAWGHSTLVGPFGEVIATAEHEETTVIAEIDYSLIDQRRQFLPLQYQRRGDLYQLVDIQRSQKKNGQPASCENLNDEAGALATTMQPPLALHSRRSRASERQHWLCRQQLHADAETGGVKSSRATSQPFLCHELCAHL